MLSREPNCHRCNTIWFLPSSWSSMASPLTLFARVFTITAPYFYQRSVKMLQKALQYCHQCMPLGCSFAGQWALFPVPQRPVAVGASGCRMQHPTYGTNAAEMFICSVRHGAVILAPTPGRFFFGKITSSLICIFACCY